MEVLALFPSEFSTEGDSLALTHIHPLEEEKELVAARREGLHLGGATLLPSWLDHHKAGLEPV